MDTRRVATEIRLSQWAQVIQGRMESGQSIEAYCQAVGVSKNTYFYWQRKLRGAVCEQISGKHVQTPAAMNGDTGFAEVKLSEAQTRPVQLGTSEAGQLHVETDAVRITVDSKYPPEKLAELLRAFLRTC